MTKKVLSVVLAVLMVVSMMSVMAVSANAAPSDFSTTDTKTVFVTDSKNWDGNGVLKAYYWKVKTNGYDSNWNPITETVAGDWVDMTYLYDNSMNQSVYGVVIPDDANWVLFSKSDKSVQTTDTKNVYDGSWWYIDDNKDCKPCSGDVFETAAQTGSLSAAFVNNTGADRYFNLDGNYYFVDANGNISKYNNTSELMVAEANGNQYTNVNDAVAAAGEGGAVKLIADIVSNVGIDGDYTTTLDLNGHTITNTSGSGITLYSKYNGDKTFTIKDTSAAQTGAITINKKYDGDGCISDSSGRKVVIEGGTYTSDGNALYISSDNGWTINGGTFNGNIKVVSALDVTGGTINGDINATGPSWKVDPAEVTISGGTVNGNLNTENGSTYVVSGGTFTDDVSAYTTAATYQNANGEVVAKAANTIYDDGDFAKAAAEGGSWYIVADVNADGVTVAKSLKVWNNDKTHKITGNITVADNAEFAIAGRKTTNIDGDITLAGQDSKVVSTRANKVILTQPYKTGQVYGVPAATKVLYDGKEIVFDSSSLTNAASKGGTFYVVDDFTMNAAVSPSKDLSLIGLKADSTRPTITVASTSSTRTAFNAFNPTNGTNLSIEGINFAATKTDEKVIGVVNTNTASSADKYSTITIKDSDISGFSVADGYGAVYLHGYSHATLTNVQMSGNGKYDVWGGAATDVTINGGSYESVYLNGGVAKATVEGTAAIDEITAAEGTTIEASDYANVKVADGYKLKDNDDGSKTVVACEYVAQIGTTKYESLEEAFAAANDGETITVLADCEGNGIIVPQGKFATGLTVDFGGNTYTVSGTPVGSRGTESIGFQLLKDNNITFQNGTITADCRVNPRDGKYLQRMIQNYSNLTLDDMTVSMIGQYYDQATISTCNGKTVIKDSTVSAPDFTWLGYNKSSDVGGVALTMGTFASYPSIDVKVTDGSTIDGDIKVSDDNNKKAFSLSLEDGSMNGNIVLDETAKAAIDDSPATASVKKADEFNQAAPEGYKWVATETAGVYKVAPFTLQDYVDETFGTITGFTFADASANMDGISANSASLVGVQIRQLPDDTKTTEYSYDEEGNKEAGLRFVATMSKALYEKYENVAGFDYGFEINGRKFSCKDSVNNVAEGHENIRTASDYAVMTLALKGINDSNKNANLTVKFFVETAEDATVYADYAKAGITAKEFTTTYNQVAAHI